MIWSNYQKAVFDFVTGSPENVFINAVAGSGKTTVIVQCIEDVPSEQTALAVAFGRDIRKTLEGKLGHLPNVTVKTLNGLGYEACRKAIRRYINIKGEKTKDTLFFDILGGKKATDEQKNWYYKCRHLICKIISIFKADMTWYPVIADMWAVMDRFNLDLPKGVSEDQLFDLLLVTFSKCMDKTMVMDFDDQIAMPLRFGWPIPQYDWVFVDEAQDLTPAQIELTRRVGGRAVYVGDPRQAIYQFRGADSNATNNIIKSMVCTELPLSICYRCSKSVIREAQKIVPHIECHDDALEGEVAVIKDEIFQEKVKEGDLVLSRCTAPLVRACLNFIRKGRKATIKGREIGESLIELVKEVADGLEDVGVFQEHLSEYVHKKEEKLRDKEAALIQLHDMSETILCFEASSVSELIEMISKIFSDDAQGINLMTGHKSKGLEFDNVFIVAPETIPHKLATTEEAKLAEANLAYVMITRARLNLYFVGGTIRV